MNPLHVPKIIFLDVDGVLNTYDRNDPNYGGLSAEHLLRLQRIVLATGAKIVVSSTWRKSPEALARLHGVLNDYGLATAGETPVLNDVFGVELPRDWEVIAFLSIAVPPVRFVILDDESFTHKALVEWAVKVNPMKGLADDDATTAIRLLNLAV